MPHRTDQRQRQGRAVYVWCSGRQCATLTASTAGLVCNDHPVTVQWPAEVTGVAFSPGFLTFAGGPIAAGPGIVTLRCHAKSAVISGITGPTNINVATQVVAGANAQTDFPCVWSSVQHRTMTRSTCSTKTVGLRMTFKSLRRELDQSQSRILERRQDPVCHRCRMLNAAVSAEAKQEWVTCFSDSTSLGSFVQHIRTYANGYNQREQFLVVGLDAGVCRCWCDRVRHYAKHHSRRQRTGQPRSQRADRMPKRRTAGLCACGNAGVRARAAERRMTRNWDGFQLVSNLPGIPLTISRRCGSAQRQRGKPGTHDVFP